MGKWAEVQCACPNRKPLPGSDFMFGKPHRNKHRLTKKEAEEVAEWERTTRNMYECGHRDGVVIEFSPGEIINLGDIIRGIFEDGFEIFKRAGDWRCYEDELLLIQPDESELWLMEIDEIRRALDGAGNLPPQKIERLILEFLRRDLGARSDLARRLDEVSAQIPFAGLNALKENVAQSEQPTVESTIKKIDEALADVARLCRASIETRNPIRLLW